MTAASNQRWGVACANLLQNCYAMDPDVFRFTWELCVEIFDGDPIVDTVFSGLFHLESALRKRTPAVTLERQDLRDCITGKGVLEIKKAIANARVMYQKGGAKVYAEGILTLLNKGKRRRIESLYGRQGEE